MRVDSARLDNTTLWNSGSSKAFFAGLATLLAFTTAGSLFFILRVAPQTRDAAVTVYYVTCCSLLPWVSGCVFWIKVGKRAKLNIADREATGLCYRMIFNTVLGAYAALISIEGVLLESCLR